jgi:chorismate dehydratase
MRPVLTALSDGFTATVSPRSGERQSLGLNCGLPRLLTSRPRVCAVSYLNTTPLVWGMLHGQQCGLFDLEFRIPSGCADQLASGAADIGIVPSFELTRLKLEVIPGTGIACRGPVRSILMISSRPAGEIRTLAADSSSRTSVELARVILERKYGASPALIRQPPDLETMLRSADAALIIGDPALRIDPVRLPYFTYDLGAEWVEMTGLPMVFAVWAGRGEVVTELVAEAFRESCRFGRERIEEIVASEAPRREFAPALVREYLTRNIVHELEARDYEGLELFLRYARKLVQTG